MPTTNGPTVQFPPHQPRVPKGTILILALAGAVLAVVITIIVVLSNASGPTRPVSAPATSSSPASPTATTIVVTVVPPAITTAAPATTATETSATEATTKVAATTTEPPTSVEIDMTKACKWAYSGAVGPAKGGTGSLKCYNAAGKSLGGFDGERSLDRYCGDTENTGMAEPAHATPGSGTTWVCVIF